MYSRVFTLMYYALTPLHVGSGRSGGRVDLVIQRDPYGVPVIYSTSIKGAIKSIFYRCGVLDYRIFGGDINFNISEYESIVVFTDSYPLAFPIKLDSSLIYVTSPYLLKKVLNVLELSNHNLIDTIRKLYQYSYNIDNYAISLCKERFYICSRELCIEARPGQNVDVNILENLPYPADKISNSLVVVPDSFLLSLLNDGIIIHTRIGLDYYCKRTRRGFLWSEEYVPAGTIFIGTMLIKDKEHIFNNVLLGRLEECEDHVNTLINILRDGIIVTLGGKETIGKGFMRISMI